jgi:hypothetical protein
VSGKGLRRLQSSTAPATTVPCCAGYGPVNLNICTRIDCSHAMQCSNLTPCCMPPPRPAWPTSMVLLAHRSADVASDKDTGAPKALRALLSSNPEGGGALGPAAPLGRILLLLLLLGGGAAGTAPGRMPAASSSACRINSKDRRQRL